MSIGYRVGINTSLGTDMGSVLVSVWQIILEALSYFTMMLEKGVHGVTAGVQGA